MDKIHHKINQMIHGEYRNITILIAGAIIMLVGEFSTTLSVTKILRAFENGGTAVQLINILPLIILALMYPLGPVWLQKRSIARLFKDALLIFIIGAVIVSIAPNLLVLIIGRVIQTVGCGIMLPMLPALVENLLPEDKQISNLHQMEDFVLGVAIILALFLTGIFFLIGKWQLINIFLIIMSLIIYHLASRIKIDLEVSPYEVEWLNVGLSCGAFLLVGWLVTLTKVGAKLPSWSGTFLLISGVVMIALYIWRECKVENPLIDFRSLMDIRFLRSVMLQGMGTSSLAVLMVMGVLYLRQGLGYPSFLVGLSLMPAIIVGIAVHHLTKPFFDRFDPVINVRIATGIMMLGWGCLSLFSTYLNLTLFIVLTMLIEAGHGLLVQVGKNLSREQKSQRLANMADIFTNRFKLMSAGMVLAILSVVLQDVTESKSSLPGDLSSLIGYRAAFSIFFVITILGWIITMFAGRNLSKHVAK